MGRDLAELGFDLVSKPSLAPSLPRELAIRGDVLTASPVMAGFTSELASLWCGLDTEGPEKGVWRVVTSAELLERVQACVAGGETTRGKSVRSDSTLGEVGYGTGFDLAGLGDRLLQEWPALSDGFALIDPSDPERTVEALIGTTVTQLTEIVAGTLNAQASVVVA